MKNKAELSLGAQGSQAAARSGLPAKCVLAKHVIAVLPAVAVHRAVAAVLATAKN